MMQYWANPFSFVLFCEQMLFCCYGNGLKTGFKVKKRFLLIGKLFPIRF